MGDKESTAVAASGDYLFSELWYRCVTPVHVGVGQDVGIVDLPVARERATSYPLLPGSGLRGALRERFKTAEAGTPIHAGVEKQSTGEPTSQAGDGNETLPPSVLDRLFGPEDSSEPIAGCVSVIDGRILFFPLRASRDVFVWATCPFILERYSAEYAYFLQKESKLEIPLVVEEDKYLGSGNGKLWLEEYPFEKSASSQKLSWPPDLPPWLEKERLIVISNVAFAHFSRFATIVRQRNHLTSAKTVAEGQLFSVEAVPPDAVFYGFLGTTKERHPEAARGVPKGPLSAEYAMRELRGGLADRKMRDQKSPADGKERTNAGAKAGPAADGQDFHLVVGGEESVGMGMTQVSWRKSL